MATKGKVIRWLWDSASDRETGQGICISATPEDFRLVASYLLNFAFRWPDDDLENRNLNSRVIFDRELRGAAQHIALQMLNADTDCEPDMPFPIFRMNPENACQTQQSLDSGSTWTTIIDTSVCQPEIPDFPTIPPMIQLRQHPTQPQILQQSLDGGSSWTTAFDYSLYKPRPSRADEVTIYNDYTETVNNYLETWETDSHDISIFAPNMVFDGGDTEDDAQRDKAICYAIGVWYDAMKDTVVAYWRTEGDRAAAAAAGGVGTIVGGVATPFAGVVVGAIVGALVKGINELAAHSQESAYTEARAEIICCMYDALIGETLTQARFMGSVDSCSFAEDSNTEAIRILVDSLVQDTAVYLSFLKVASAGFDYAEFAELPDCMCDDEEPPEPRTPVINSLWDPVHIAGTVEGPDEDGFYTATSENRGSDVAFTIMDVSGRPFVLTDVTYSEAPSCQVWLLESSLNHIACTGSDMYGGDTVDEFTATWSGSGTHTMTFKMVGP